MVFVLKKQEARSKGIIMFTHKEAHLLRTKNKTLVKRISSVKQHYYFGMHFGWYSPNFILPPCIDFILAGPGTFPDPPENIPHIEMCSRDFIPHFFDPGNNTDLRNRHFDIICVGNNVRTKKINEFLVMAREVMDARPNTTILLVTSGPKKQREPRFYSTLRQDYFRMFTQEERQYFSMIDFRRDHKELYGLGYNAVPWLLKSAKLLAHFSEVEGGVKIISEALVCGTPVMVKQNLSGGGLDHTSPENSILMKDAKDAAQKALLHLENPENLAFDVTSMQKKIREDYSVPVLIEKLKEVFSFYGTDFSGSIDGQNLARKLPAHNNQMSAKLTNTFTDDLNSPLSLYQYLEDYDSEISSSKVREIADIYFYNVLYNGKKKVTNLVRFGKNFLKYILIKLNLYKV